MQARRCVRLRAKGALTVGVKLAVALLLLGSGRAAALVANSTNFDQIQFIVSSQSGSATQIGGGQNGKTLLVAADFVPPSNSTSGVATKVGVCVGGSNPSVKCSRDSSCPGGYCTYNVGATLRAYALNTSEPGQGTAADIQTNITGSPTDLTFTLPGTGGPDGTDGDGSIKIDAGNFVEVDFENLIVTPSATTVDLVVYTNTAGPGTLLVTLLLGGSPVAGQSASASVIASTAGSGNGGITFNVPDGTVYDGVRLTGQSGSIEVDAVAARQGEVCGNGTVEGGESCDDGDTADGDCCSSTCGFEPDTTVCRPAAGECDVAETCTGSSGTCPSDDFEPDTTECRASAGECDAAEFCTGSTADCPADDFTDAGTACTSDGNPCTVDECNGSGTCTHPAGNAGTTCRVAAGLCDLAESCTGVSTLCPPDEFLPSGSVCRAAAGDCDLEETCSGTDPSCPADAPAPPGTACTSDGDVCTSDECDSDGVCTHPVTLLCCGNGIIETGEQCDDGAGNSDTEPEACRTDCTLPGCADVVTDAPKADFLIIADRSESMERDLRQLRGHLEPLPALLNFRGFDYRLAVVRYGTRKSGGPSDPQLVLDFTSDETAFRVAISGLADEITRPVESGTGAMDFALANLAFRPNAERVIVLLTDEDDDLPAALGGKEPPGKWLTSSLAAQFQARLDATAQALINEHALLFMLMNPRNRPSDFQFGSPAATVLNGDRLDPAPTLANLVAQQQEQSLQGQLLASGICQSGLCTQGRVGLGCTSNADCALISQAFDIRDQRRNSCTAAEFWNQLLAQLVDATNCEGFVPVPDPNDTDADGQTNDTDVCTVTSVGLPSCPPDQIVKSAKVSLQGLDKGAGQQRLTARGLFNPATTTPAIDPALFGVHVRLEDGLGVLYDVSIPGGPIQDPPSAHCGSKDGWKDTFVQASGTTIWTYVNDSGLVPPGCLPGSARGIYKVQLKDLRNRPSKLAFEYTVKARDDTLPRAPEFPVTRMQFDFVTGAQPSPGTASVQAELSQCAESLALLPGSDSFARKPYCKRSPRSGTLRTVRCAGL